MNRAWETPQRHVAPPIYYFKRLIKDVKAVCEVLLFCDLHGHSRKRDVFLYGCNCDDDPAVRYHERVFPHVFAQVICVRGIDARPPHLMTACDGNSRPPRDCHPLTRRCPPAQCCPSFEISSCTFKVQEDKRSTARVICRSEFDLLNSFTLEASFAGSDDQGTAKPRHFRMVDLCNIGTGKHATVLKPQSHRNHAVSRRTHAMTMRSSRRFHRGAALLLVDVSISAPPDGDAARADVRESGRRRVRL